MPGIPWSPVQTDRLKTLEAAPELLAALHGDEAERNAAFQTAERELIRNHRQSLDELKNLHRKPALVRLGETLAAALNGEGFVQVTSPTIISRSSLAKMSITEDDPLFRQVFWLEGGETCLRPMLAPNLYALAGRFLRLWEKPVGIFEIGSCFRKESRGSRHAAEFTMLNLCEFGLPLDEREERLRYLLRVVAEASGIRDYELTEKGSTVYGVTMDLVAGPQKLELASCAMGPHPLDYAWKITDPWIGAGFGLERILMHTRGSGNLGRMARSLFYQDGIPLNI